MAEFVYAAGLMQNWDSKFKNEQRDYNREHAVAERLDPIEPQFALSKALR